MILKPFMLRRIKKDVENELSDKVMSFGLSGRIVVLNLLLNNTVSKFIYVIFMFCNFQTFNHSDWNLDILPADQQTAAPLPGSEEQDLHRGPAAVINGIGPAGPQHHQQPHEPRHAVQEGKTQFISFKEMLYPKITVLPSFTHFLC